MYYKWYKCTSDWCFIRHHKDVWIVITHMMIGFVCFRWRLSRDWAKKGSDESTQQMFVYTMIQKTLGEVTAHSKLFWTNLVWLGWPWYYDIWDVKRVIHGRWNRNNTRLSDIYGIYWKGKVNKHIITKQFIGKNELKEL